MPGGNTDTIGATVRPGSFVVKRGSSILNEKLLDKILGKKPKKYAGGGAVDIWVTDGERIATPEEVDMYGIDFFRAINNSSDNAAHENIDALIGQAQLSNMSPMFGGGEVSPEGYQEGDLVENKKGALSTLVEGLIRAGKQQSAGLLGKYRHDANEEVVPQDITLEIPDFAKTILANRPRYDASKAIEKAIEEEQRMLLDARKLRKYRGGFRMPRGYQGGDLVQDPNDPLGINQRQADPSMYAGSVIQGAGGGMPDAASALDSLSPQDSLRAIGEAQDSLNAMKANKLMELIRELQIRGEGEAIESSGDYLHPLNQGRGSIPLR